MEEIFADAKGYEKFFKVSNLGRVWSKRTNKYLKVSLGPTGYFQFCTRFGGRGSRAYCIKVHRLVAETFIEVVVGKEQVNHIDGDKQNNSYNNLEWVTAKENSEHAVSMGLTVQKKSINHPLSKIPEDAVDTIIGYYGKLSSREVARIYNVSKDVILRLWRTSIRD